jgi:GTP-binding protein HflX
MRGIGLHELRQRVLGLIEQDFVERISYIPVSEAKTIAHVHRVADVISEDYMYARNGDPSEKPVAVARLQFRCARKHERDLDLVLARFTRLAPVADG